MTTNETPYRPQINDKVYVTVGGTLREGVVAYVADELTQVYLDGVWWSVSTSDLRFISRADGVPVEKAVDLQKENEELRTKLAALQRRTDRHDHAKDLGQAVEGDAVVMARITSDRDEWRAKYDRECKDSEKLIKERDATEDMVEALLDQIGIDYEWSNFYGYPEALQEASDVIDHRCKERDQLRKELAEAKSVLTNFSTWSDDQCSWNDAGVRARAIASAFLASHQPPSAVDTQHVFSDDSRGDCFRCGNGPGHPVHHGAVDTQQVNNE